MFGGARWRQLGYVGGVAAAAGSVLPWGHVSITGSGLFAGTSQSATVNGLDGDGTITLALAVGALAVLALAAENPLGRLGAAVLGGLVVLVAAMDLAELADLATYEQRFQGTSAIDVSVEPGVGLLATLAGGLLVVLGGALGYWRAGRGG